MQTTDSKVYGAVSLVGHEQWIGSEKIRAISPTSLSDWARQTEHVTNRSVDEIAALRTKQEQTDAQLAELKRWVEGSCTFLEFMIQRYPEVVREFNVVENAKARVGGSSTEVHIVENE